ncbi:MAG TPA: Yip1 family protein [Candidatus Binataceae bacterium]|nr:Yip1 family protein [Candidatus Binataceae bacterium]
MGDVIADRVIPFFSIWVIPRSTIRRVVDTEPDSLVIGIAWILGALIALTIQVEVNAGVLKYQALDWFKEMGPAAMGMTVFSAGIAAIGMVYFLGFVYAWAGRVLGGLADARDVRTAVAWGWVPAIILSLVAITSTLFDPGSNAWDKAPSTILDQITVWLIAEIALKVWAFLVSVQTLAEVHRFSAWRAVATKGIGFLVVGFVGLGIFILMTSVSLVASMI